MNIIDDLIEKHAPKEREFNVRLAEVMLRFRVIQDYSQWALLQNNATKFAAKLCDPLPVKDGKEQPRSVPASWLPFLPSEREAAGLVFTLSACCLGIFKPDPKLPDNQVPKPEALSPMPHLEFLKLQAKLPPLFALVRDAFAANQMVESANAEADRIDELKNDSSETLSGNDA